MADAGRDFEELELVGGVRGRFPDPASTADLDEALAAISKQLERGFTSICIKPSQYLDDMRGFARWCGEVVRRADAFRPPG
jgi:hypothetical protein